MRMRKGFTLIELLVVIAIIGILATLVITQVSGAQQRARNSNAKSDVTQMGKAVELFKNDEAGNGSVMSVSADATLAGTTAAGGNFGTGRTLTTVFSGTQSINGATSTYGAAVTKSPSATHVYTYESSTAAAGTLTSTGYSIWTQVYSAGSVTDNSFCILNGSTINGTSATGAPTGCANPS